MKRELKDYRKAGYRVLENDNAAFTMFNNGKWIVRTFDDRGNMLTEQWKNGTKYEFTYDDENNMLTTIKNGKLTYDNRPKEISITLTQSQLDKIKKAGIL